MIKNMLYDDLMIVLLIEFFFVLFVLFSLDVVRFAKSLGRVIPGFVHAGLEESDA